MRLIGNGDFSLSRLSRSWSNGDSRKLNETVAPTEESGGEREREREKEKMRPIYFCLTYLSFSLLDESEIFHSPRSNRSPSCLTNGFDVYCIGCPKINARFEFAAIFALSCWLKKEQFDSWTMYLKNKYLKTLFYI